MSETTTIEWCDATFSPFEGCQKVSPVCDNCYAEKRNARFSGGTAINWGPGAPRRRTSEANWRKPLQWNGVGTDFPSFDLIPCQYGMPGDRLWAREAWRTTGDDGRADDMPPRDLQPHPVWFEADGHAPVDLCAGKYHPSMFMPRWASRIALAVTNVRIESLQTKHQRHRREV